MLRVVMLRVEFQKERGEISKKLGKSNEVIYAYER